MTNGKNLTEIRGTSKILKTKTSILYEQICKSNDIKIVFDDKNAILIEVSANEVEVTENEVKNMHLCYQYLLSREFLPSEIRIGYKNNCFVLEVFPN